MLNKLLKEIKDCSNKEKALILQRFFKTWKWQYWEGDLFHWITVPIQRSLVKKYYRNLNLEDIKILISSKFHEERLIWVLLLVYKFEKTKNEPEQKEIFNFYIANSSWINNWDLVDLSAPNIVWKYLLDRNKELLYELSYSSSLWKRRISIIATFTFIRSWNYNDSINIVLNLINDKEDLIHKACWWMLREIWKRNEIILIDFLNKYSLNLKRTTLRYAIERLNKEQKEFFMTKK